MAAVALLGLVGCANVSPASPPAQSTTVLYQADYPFYESAAALAARTDVIVTGTVTASRAEMIDIVAHDVPSDDPMLNPAGTPAPPSFMAYTLHDVRVAAVGRGDVAVGETITVGEPGGVVDGVPYLTSEGIQLVDGRTYTLFLARFGDHGYQLVNPAQGV
ncbi:MAG: hypothetical protein FWC46_02485, partial [Actinomycetia bacterium]|nr:hypothetical protein [Actinomycetes bacterium]